MKSLKKKNKFFFSFLISLILLFETCFSAWAAEITTNSIVNWPQGPSITAATAVLYDADTGAILYNKGMDETRYPASTTKLMTALLAIENSSLDAQVTMGEYACQDVYYGSTNINCQPGEVLTMDQCLHAILLASANEVSTQVAEYISGSVSAFADKMNERAAQIGCTNTHFSNANGLHDDSHYTTAHDLALIMAECIKNETFLSIEKDLTYTIPATNLTAEAREFQQHHVLMLNGDWHYDGVFAGKTGFTDEAGQTLVTACKKDGHTLICVVMGGTNPTYFNETKDLLNYGYQNFSLANIKDADGNTLDAKVTVPSTTRFEDLTVTEKEISSPGDVDRTYRRSYSYNGAELGSTTYIVPAEPVSSSSEETANSSEDTQDKLDELVNKDGKNSSSTWRKVSSFLHFLASGFLRLGRMIGSYLKVIVDDISNGEITSPVIIFLLIDLAAIILLVFAFLQRKHHHRKTHPELYRDDDEDDDDDDDEDDDDENKDNDGGKSDSGETKASGEEKEASDTTESPQKKKGFWHRK